MVQMNGHISGILEHRIRHVRINHRLTIVIFSPDAEKYSSFTEYLRIRDEKLTNYDICYEIANGIAEKCVRGRVSLPVLVFDLPVRHF